MKAHIGVDSKTRQIHWVVATAANVHDSQVLEDLLHGDETRYGVTRHIAVKPRRYVKWPPLRRISLMRKVVATTRWTKRRRSVT